MAAASAVDVAREFWRRMATSDFDSDASEVADGAQRAKAISFCTNGAVERRVEFSPEPGRARAGRAHLVEPGAPRVER